MKAIEKETDEMVRGRKQTKLLKEERNKNGTETVRRRLETVRGREKRKQQKKRSKNRTSKSRKTRTKEPKM